MQVEEPILKGTPPRTKLVVLCHEADREQVRAVITAICPVDWERLEKVQLKVCRTRARPPGSPSTDWTPRQESAFLRDAELDAVAPPAESPRLVVVGRVDLESTLSRFDLRAPIFIRTPVELAEKLPKVFENAGLDWLTDVSARLEHYHLGLEQDAVNSWRQQFSRFKKGGNLSPKRERSDLGWIGDDLLKLLDFWPSSKVCEAIFRVPGDAVESSEDEICRWLDGYGAVAFNAAETGDSSAVVCRLAKTRVGDVIHGRRVDFATHIRGTDEATRILLLEDCLMTGTETMRLLSDLSPDQAAHDRLAKHDIDLKFAQGTMFGYKRLQAFLEEKKLNRVTILEPAGGFLQNLTNGALQSSDVFDDDLELRSPREHLIDGIRLRAGGYYNSGRRRTITAFCKIIGGLLMAEHLKEKGWTREKIDRFLPRWELGYSGLGLLIAFGHGVPKPTLPLFRVDAYISGEVFGRPFELHWKPLFRRSINRRDVPADVAATDRCEPNRDEGSAIITSGQT